MHLRLAVPLALSVLLVGVGGRAAAQAPDGPALFTEHCAMCHEGGDPRAPATDTLRAETPAAIVDALATGVMRQQGAALAGPEREAIATFLAGGTAAPAVSPTAGRCAAPPPFDAAKPPAWSGWSGPGNTRFQPADRAGLEAGDIPRLTLKWAFAFPGATSVRALPAVAGGRLFVGSEAGTVYALDAASGCVIWTFQAKGGVRAAITIRPGADGGRAYVGDISATVYALNATTGDLEWSRQVDSHPFARITGAPTLYDGRLYVPVSSLEEGQGRSPTYECCTFRGSVVALDASTGAVIWKTYTVSAEPRAIGTREGGITRRGPAGAAVWSSPTVDAKRRLVYAATGNMYSEPQQETSDAVLALSLDTGEIAWAAQVTPRDVFVVGCNGNGAVNCPDELGPDFDFGNSPMLTTTPGGRDLIVLGQKSGVGWALDPDHRGAVVWDYRAGSGSALGGMEWGSATDGRRAYFPVSDVLDAQQQPRPGPSSGWLHAVDLATGQKVWSVPPPPFACGSPARNCNGALSAAITAIPGAIFAGSNDGAVRAYSSADGSVLWTFDANRAFDTTNGEPGLGGSINGAGPIVADGLVYVGAGSGSGGGRPGNVLLAFGVR